MANTIMQLVFYDIGSAVPKNKSTDWLSVKRSVYFSIPEAQNPHGVPKQIQNIGPGESQVLKTTIFFSLSNTNTLRKTKPTHF